MLDIPAAAMKIYTITIISLVPTWTAAHSYRGKYLRCFRLLLSMKALHRSDSLESLGFVEMVAQSSFATGKVRLEGKESVYRYLQQGWASVRI